MTHPTNKLTPHCKNCHYALWPKMDAFESLWLWLFGDLGEELIKNGNCMDPGSSTGGYILITILREERSEKAPCGPSGRRFEPRDLERERASRGTHEGPGPLITPENLVYLSRLFSDIYPKKDD